jgi:hypothetical protein
VAGRVHDGNGSTSDLDCVAVIDHSIHWHDLNVLADPSEKCRVRRKPLIGKLESALSQCRFKIFDQVLLGPMT